MKCEKFRILAVDGGGSRGYLSASILSNIENYVNNKDAQDIPLGSRFDFIAGTSIGAIIALGLAYGQSISYIKDKLKVAIRDSFLSPRNFATRLIKPKFDNLKLKSHIYANFRGLKIEDLETDFLITTTNLKTAKPKIFSSNYTKDEPKESEKIENIALYACLAPSYFSADSYLIDGGIYAANPSLIAITEALRFNRKSKRGLDKPSSIGNIMLLSIGTGEIDHHQFCSKKLINGGKLDWAKSAIDVNLQAQATYDSMISKGLLGENYKRVNPKIPFRMNMDSTNNLEELSKIASLDKETVDFLDKLFL